jgi:hypothetical protein
VVVSPPTAPASPSESGIDAAPGLLAERNVVAYGAYGVSLPAIAPGTGDAADGDSIFRQNSFIDLSGQSFSLTAQSGAVTQSENLDATSAQLTAAPSAANAWKCSVGQNAAVAGACTRE